MDAYAVLGVHPGATDEEIRDAYLRRSKELHPDRFAEASPDARAAATRAMQELNAAYGALRRRDQSAAGASAPPWTAPPPPAAPGYYSRPKRRRFRLLLIPVVTFLIAAVLAVASGGRGETPADITTIDLTKLEGECLVLGSSGELEDIVDCTRPHDARVMTVVDRGTACPVWTHASMTGPTKTLCLDTHQ